MAEFEAADVLAGAVCKVRATGTDGVSVPATAVQSGKKITLPFTPAVRPWAKTVKFYTTRPNGKPFTLAWELSLDNGNTWTGIGKTMHTAYITLEATKTINWQETLYEIGCRNSNGKSTPDAVVDAVWGEFSGRKVSRVGAGPADPPRDPDGMIYWKPGGSYPAYLSNLLSGQVDATTGVNSAYGSCGTWAQFFHEVLMEQGINTAIEVRVIAPIPKDESADYTNAVKDYETQFLAGSGNHAQVFFPIRGGTPPDGTKKGDVLLIPASNNGANNGIFFVKNWGFGAKKFLDPNTTPQYSPLPEQKDSPAQGNKRPRAWFGDHQIVRYKNAGTENYYDPSYGGAPFKAPNLNTKWEDYSIQAYGAVFLIKLWDGTVWGSPKDILWFERLHTTGTSECEFNPPPP